MGIFRSNIVCLKQDMNEGVGEEVNFDVIH